MTGVTVYYVTHRGERVEGPFESRREAKRLADELMTNEVGLAYEVEPVPE